MIMATNVYRARLTESAKPKPAPNEAVTHPKPNPRPTRIS